MALVWITSVLNTTTDLYLRLRQTDPSKHPVIRKATKFWRLDNDGCAIGERGETIATDLQIKNGEWFGLGPGGEIQCDWFVIPWANTGGWVIAVASSDLKAKPEDTDGLRFQIMPGGGGKRDYLEYFKRDHTPLELPYDVGDAGPFNSTSGRLVLSPEAFYYKSVDAHSTGSDVADLARTIGAALLEALVPELLVVRRAVPTKAGKKRTTRRKAGKKK